MCEEEEEGVAVTSGVVVGRCVNLACVGEGWSRSSWLMAVSGGRSGSC